ncbi:hypothetical protein H7B90_00835 [Cohnella xylanilytica]|uniref:DnaD/phage-associated family protein n=1 Tax=Cohnella xylanilytica TaxID=557555 RepID=A0A841TNU8_9BACL|nr:hypothetical protein [Cohnella xylanilytica]MBB6689937.1 hypothetical protein [Cohnella xylanilytica]
MDFMEETNAFSDWLETNPLEASAQTLWFHLMVIANKSGWPEWFAVANPLLQAKVGISENSLTKHRNILVQKGRIEYKSQGKKQKGQYRIIPFTPEITSNYEAKRGVNRGVMRGVIGGVKGSAYKDLKDFTAPPTTTAREPQSLTEAYSLVFGGGTMPGLFSNFLFPILEEYGERYAIELILESGESGKSPSLRHVQSIHDGWVARGVRSREEAKAERVTVPFKPRNTRERERDELQQFIEEERSRGTR